MNRVLVDAAALRVRVLLDRVEPELRSLARRVAECPEPPDVGDVLATLGRLADLADTIRTRSAEAATTGAPQ